MERHKCKLCFKLFANGRALGGHMRSHTLNLPHKQEDDGGDHHRCSPIQLADDTESASSSEEEPKTDGEDEKGVCYELRENPKPSVRLVDPEFAFAVDVSSVVLQDRESETESSKNPTRRRSKRTRKLSEHHQYHHHSQIRQQDHENNTVKKLKFSNKTTESSWGHEPEPVSSISDATTEENVAFCLMMLSRDKWKRKEKQDHQERDDLDDDDEDDDEEEEETERSIEETDESDGFKSCKPRAKGKYRCETCNKVFKSYQALGGHRASHKKLKLYTSIQETELETRNNNNSNAVTPGSASAKRIHECPYCFRVFSSGQALGGHKRSHGLASATQTSHIRSSTTSKTEDNLNLIDLNLPAPVDEDDVSQVELSAVSDAEFVNHIKR